MSPMCFLCQVRPAGNDYAGPCSAYCGTCQPRDSRPQPKGAQCECAGCGQVFPTLRAFEDHDCGPAREVLRDRRRTSVITMGPDAVELCEPECRNEFLLDLGVPGARNGNYPARGEATVVIVWSGMTRRVSWRRRRLNDHDCDLCGDGWRRRVPGLVAKARARSKAMRGAEPAFQARFPESGARAGGKSPATSARSSRQGEAA